MRRLVRARGWLWVWILLTGAGCHDVHRLVTLRPAAVFDEGLLDFGDVPVGEWRQATAHLRNVSNTPFRAEDARQLLDNPSFSIDLGPGPVMAGEVRPVKVNFHPLQEGELVDRLKVDTDFTQNAPQPVTLRGRGTPTPIGLDPALLDFQTLEIDSDRTLEVQVTNPVDLPLSITLAGPNAAQFSPDRFTVAPHTTLRLKTTYAPQALGTSAAELDVRSCDGCTPTVLALKGNTVASAFSFDPSPMPFDDIPVHQSTQSLTHATNVTWRPVVISGFQTSDPAFVALDPPGQVVQPGQTVDLHVQFSARTSGTKLGTLDVHYTSDHARKSTEPLDARGGRPQLALTPITIDFGDVPVGDKVQRVVRLANAGTNGPLHFQGVTATGDTGQFGVNTPRRGATLYPWSGGTWPALQAPNIAIQPAPDYLDVPVDFAPVSAGQFRATVNFHSDDLFNPSRPVVVMGSAHNSGPCNATISPSDKLDFGNMPVGSGAVLGFRFQNVGTTECAVKDIHLSQDANGAFFMPGGAIVGGVVPPGTAFSAQIAFRPPADGNYQGQLSITVNNPTHPLMTLPLVAVSQATCLTAAPPFIDFGPIRYDCPVTARGTYVTNQCTHPVTVSSVTIGEGTSNQFSFVNPPPVPKTLQPGDGFEVDVTYSRTVLGQHFSPMYFAAAGEPVPYMVPLLGETNHEGMQVDEFTQGTQNQLDMLLVVDNSTTMGGFQQRLAAAMPNVLAQAQQAGVDLQIGVTTTGLYAKSAACPGGANGGEAGRLFPADGSSPRIVTPATPNAAGVLEGNVQVGTCQNLVQGLETMREALSSPLVDHADDPLTPLPNDGNLGILRATARLAIVAIADEDDQSGFDPGTYAQFVQSVKGTGMAQRVSFSAIIPTAADQCVTAGAPGPRFATVAQQTGGQIASVCDGSYSDLLTGLVQQAAGLQRDFRLSEPPADPNSIVVLLNGQVEGLGAYYYYATQNAVVFNDGFVPQPGDQITVKYQAACSVIP